MVIESLVAPLKRVPLFNGLTEFQVRAIADTAERVVIDAGTTIIAENRPGDAAYLVVRGRAARLDGIGRPTGPVPAGSMVGEMAMLIETTHVATVVAIEAVMALKLTRAAMLAVMHEDPDIAAHFVSKLTVRLRHLASDLREVEAGLAPAAQPRQPAGRALAS